MQRCRRSNSFGTTEDCVRLGPPYDFAWPGDVTFYPYGTTYTTTVVEPYHYTGPYVGPLLYRP